MAILMTMVLLGTLVAICGTTSGVAEEPTAAQVNPFVGSWTLTMNETQLRGNQKEEHNSKARHNWSESRKLRFFSLSHATFHP